MRRLCEECSIGAWTSDSAASVAVNQANNAGRLTWIAVADGETQNLIVSPDETVNRPFPSPDGRLLAFRRQSAGQQAVMIAPMTTTDQPAPRQTWIEIAGGETDARPSGWSPDGGLLYFVSARDGARCLSTTSTVAATPTVRARTSCPPAPATPSRGGRSFTTRATSRPTSGSCRRHLAHRAV